MRGLALACSIALAIVGCGGGSRSIEAAYGAAPAEAESGASGGGESVELDDLRVRTGFGTAGVLAEGADMQARRLVPQIPGRPRFAQAPQQGQPTATDATSQPLLIYEAELGLAVHQVTAKQDQVEALARELGGFLAMRTNDTIVIRVPAAAFQGAMEQIQALGNVLSRHIEVQDVTEEFRDVETRIQTLEAMRRRVEELLRQANNVEAALAVEQQLERITVELERLRGRLRFLGDRVAFSTITVRFQERADTTEPDFQLPFGWLQLLGLQRLLQL